MPGHSRPKDGVASLAYDPGIHAVPQQKWTYDLRSLRSLMDCRVKPGNDSGRELRRQKRALAQPRASSASTSARFGAPMLPPKRVHLIAAAAEPKRIAVTSSRPSASAKATPA